MKFVLPLLIFMTSCGTQVRDDSQASVNSATIGGLGGGFEVGFIAGVEALVAVAAGSASEGVWENRLGKKPTLGAYAILGVNLGATIKATKKVGVIHFSVPNGTISGVYCGLKLGSTDDDGGIEVGVFQRKDGAKMHFGALEAGQGLTVAGECLTVVGLRI